MVWSKADDVDGSWTEELRLNAALDDVSWNDIDGSWDSQLSRWDENSWNEADESDGSWSKASEVGGIWEW